MAICKECGESDFTILSVSQYLVIERGFFGGISDVRLEDGNIATYQCQKCKRIFRYISWEKGAPLPYNAVKI